MTEKIFIRRARSDDSERVAQLHIDNIKSGFLTKLGKKPLSCIYRFIINEHDSFCFVVEIDREIIGFISATENCQLLYASFFKKNFFWGLKFLLLKILNFSIIKKILDHIFLPKKRAVLPKAELLSIVVDKKIGRSGWGSKLFIAMNNEFKKRKIEGFITVVGKSLVSSNKFMQKMQAVKISEIQVHRGEISNVYFWK